MGMLQSYTWLHEWSENTDITIDHVMPREKRWELWTALSGLLALISGAYRNFSLWHHEFIKATRSTALVVLN